MTVPKFIIFFKNYFFGDQGGPGDLRDQSEISDRGEMVSSPWSLGLCGLFGLYFLDHRDLKDHWDQNEVADIR
jgi:hypothetical protein